jgi:hypothetical protein
MVSGVGIVHLSSLRMVSLFLLYCRVESTGCFLFFGWGMFCMTAYVERWSDSGGDIVPDVICLSVSVVRITSMSVPVL